jgi:hypothetical protein
LIDRLVVNWAAVGDRSAPRDFYESRTPIVSSLVRGMAASRSVRRVVRVPGLTLDEYARTRGVGRVDILKLDIEGAEIEALHGAMRVLETVRLLYAEFHPPHSNFTDAVKWLAARGWMCVVPATPPDPAEQCNCVFVRR